MKIKIDWSRIATIAVGAIITAFVMYQLEKRTTGVIDND